MVIIDGIEIKWVICIAESCPFDFKSIKLISPHVIICFIDKMCIFSCLALKSLEYSVAYENLQPSTVAYKRVAYIKRVYRRKTRR